MVAARLAVQLALDEARLLQRGARLELVDAHHQLRALLCLALSVVQLLLDGPLLLLDELLAHQLRLLQLVLQLLFCLFRSGEQSAVLLFYGQRFRESDVIAVQPLLLLVQLVV